MQILLVVESCQWRLYQEIQNQYLVKSIMGYGLDGGMMIQQERVVLQEQDGSGRITIIF